MNQEEKNVDHIPHIEFKRTVIKMFKEYTEFLKETQHLNQLEEGRNKLMRV